MEQPGTTVPVGLPGAAESSDLPAIGLPMGGVTALTMAGVAGLPGHAGAIDIDNFRPSCYQGARPA